MSGPNTLATGQAIVAYLSALVYPTTSVPVFKLAQLEEIKDVTDLIASSVNAACAEVYADLDSSTHKSFGSVWDEQTWAILSMCSLNTPAQAAQIYLIRDALVTPFMTHYQLGNTIPGLFMSQLKAESGRFTRIMRNGQFVQAYAIDLETRVTWPVTVAP